MKNTVLITLMLVIMGSFLNCSHNQSDPSTWSRDKTDHWFEAGQWLNGWNVQPDSSINRRALAEAYFENPERWNQAFEFLKTHDLQNLELKRYDIDGDNLFATVSEYTTQSEDEKHYEAHRKYVDIQYVISGREEIGVSPLADTTQTFQNYDPAKDIGFYAVNPVKNYEATPRNFFIFFPSDAHRPGLDPGEKTQVKKLVIKLKVE